MDPIRDQYRDNPYPAIVPSGRPEPGAQVRDDAPFATVGTSAAPLDALLASSPYYDPRVAPLDSFEQEGASFAQRLQPPLGWGEGSYVQNTELDAGAPGDPPGEALPGLRDGIYRFSSRLKALGDQGVIDGLLRDGGSYLDVDQPPYYTDKPLGR